ncbi:MAG: ABC transporter ATP-binding protein [Clostridiales bacterium]|nr:ABC transporter ATP-binding protein [Clostridiales bacterium]
MNTKVTIGQFIKLHIKVFKELYQLYKLDTILIVCLSGVSVVESYIALLFLEYSTNAVNEYFHFGNDFIKIVLLFFFFLLTLFLFKIINSIYLKISEKYRNIIAYNIESKIVDRLSSISYENYESYGFYEKINLAQQAGANYPNAIYSITQMIQVIFMVMVYGVTLARIRLAFIFIIVFSMVICLLTAITVTDKQLDFWRKRVSPVERHNEYFKKIYADRINHQNMQIQRSAVFFNQKYRYFNRRERKNYLKLNIFSFSTEFISSILFLISYLFIACIVGKGVVTGIYDIGFFSMIVALLSNLFFTVKNFSRLLLHGNWYVKVLECYYDVLDMSEWTYGVNLDQKAQAEIVLQDVWYQYPQSEFSALKGIDLQFHMGEKIAIVGHNGCGKTTMVSAVLGLLKVQTGVIITDPRRISAVFQDFGQYQMTVKENIELGSGADELSDEFVCSLLKTVDLYDFVHQKPQGIYTKLGQLEHGEELSKGQWQRLAIARLLANTDARVWILDEPTAYLDPIAELEIYKLILNLAGDRLVFFISHRLGFAKNADKIIVMDNGKIAESGTHESLMEKQEIYWKMFQTQKEWYE